MWDSIYKRTFLLSPSQRRGERDEYTLAVIAAAPKEGARTAQPL